MNWKQRIRRIEDRVPTRTEPSPWATLAPYLSLLELKRLADAIFNGWPIPEAEIQRLAMRAIERRDAGMSEADVRARFDAAKGPVSGRFWRFVMRLGDRHGYGHLPGYERFGLLDLGLTDVDALVGLAASATNIAEVEEAADAIGRLWLDGRPMTVEQFSRLVLHGEYTKDLIGDGGDTDARVSAC